MSGFDSAPPQTHDGQQQPTFEPTQYQPPLDQQSQQQQQQQQPATPGGDGSTSGKGKQRRSSPIPRIRRACTACHSGKTRCSEVLPCQSCLKRGLGQTCAYPDPETEGGGQQSNTVPVVPPATFMGQIPPQPAPFYYDYSASTSTFRPAKRPRPLTEDEAAAITRNFTRGAFYVGSSGPVHVDPRLPVRLTLGEGDQVHFIISEANQSINQQML